MDIQQRKYALGRLDEAVSAKIEAFKAKQPKLLGSAPDFKSKVRMIRSGRARLKPNAQLDRHLYLVNAFIYPGDKIAARISERNKRALAAFSAKIEAEAKAIRDGLILGDAEAALRALKAFEKAR